VTPRIFRIMIAMLSFIAFSSAALGGELRVTLLNRGAVLLSIPSAWREEVSRPNPDGPPTITLSPATSADFQVLITPIWPANTSIPRLTPQSLRALVSSGADKTKSQALEKEIPVLDMVGSSVFGSYFSATDRAPKPGEYINLTQGILALEELRVTFTVLSNGDPAVALGPALKVLRSLRRE
jgi:hypothetical protein